MRLNKTGVESGENTIKERFKGASDAKLDPIYSTNNNVYIVADNVEISENSKPLNIWFLENL